MEKLHQAVTKGLTSSSKFSGSNVQAQESTAFQYDFSLLQELISTEEKEDQIEEDIDRAEDEDC